jgi:hypothetical protein
MMAARCSSSVLLQVSAGSAGICGSCAARPEPALPFLRGLGLRCVSTQIVPQIPYMERPSTYIGETRDAWLQAKS